MFKIRLFYSAHLCKASSIAECVFRVPVVSVRNSEMPRCGTLFVPVLEVEEKEVQVLQGRIHGGIYAV